MQRGKANEIEPFDTIHVSALAFFFLMVYSQGNDARLDKSDVYLQKKKKRYDQMSGSRWHSIFKSEWLWLFVSVEGKLQDMSQIANLAIVMWTDSLSLLYPQC